MSGAVDPGNGPEDASEEPIVPPFLVTVVRLTWARVNLSIRVRVEQTAPWEPPAREQTETVEDGDQTAPAAPEAPAREFRIFDGRRSFPVRALYRGDGEYDLRINITTFSERRGIPNGTWRIHLMENGFRAPAAVFDGSELGYLDESSRVFLYDSNRAVLTVSFGIAENDDDLNRLDFLMRTYQLYRDKPKRKPKRFRPLKRLKSALLNDRRKQQYAGRIYRLVNRFVGVKEGRILFASDQRVRIEGNLRRVQERLIERGLDKQFDLQYSFRLPRSGGWRTTLRIIYLMATSEFVLLDDYFGILKSLPMDPRTKVIQLWHAGSGFKSVGYSRFGNPGSPKLWHPHRQYTYAITGSEHLRHVYAEAFGIEEEAVIPTGLPRVDWFLDTERRDAFVSAFRQEHPELTGKRVVLFAPTFRGRSIYTAFYDYSQIDFDGLYEACGDDTVVLFRMHHFVKQPIEIPEQYRDRFFDFTHFADGLNLLHVTDVLITDYSSIIYEFSLLDRPMLFFAPDKVNYAATRGFHRDYDDTAPGRVCDTFDEVIDALRTGRFEQEKVAQFRAENFDRIDTGAADRVIDWLILNPEPGNRNLTLTPNRDRVDDDASATEQEVSEEEMA